MSLDRRIIREFQGQYAFLSNFYPASVVYENIIYRTVEHAFQAAKTTDLVKRDWVGYPPQPGAAKWRGRRVPLRPDWETIKESVMVGLLRQKFMQGTDLGRRLLSTGEAELIEGNTWGDTYWGVCRGEGQNRLGVLLMLVREELQGRAPR